MKDMKRNIKLLAIGAALAATFTVGTLAAPPQADASTESIKFTFAGDSLTSHADSWVKGSWDDSTLVKTGGVAVSGNTAGDILKLVKPVSADVLVIMLGTNDARLGVSRTTTLNNIKAIADKVGAARVVLVATPPSNITSSGGQNRTANNFVLNRDLSTFAWKNHWLFADPWAKMRGLDGKWMAGNSTDGVHPVASASQIVEDRMERYIRQAFEGTI